MVICAFLSLLYSFTTPFGRPSASFENSFILSLRLTMPAASVSVLYKIQLQKGFSLHAGALSHCDTHHLNRRMAWCGCQERSDQSRSSQRYMAWCGCHEIMILRYLTVPFLSNFFDLSSTACKFSLFLFWKVDSLRCSVAAVQN
jgi:hypothetical protein